MSNSIVLERLPNATGAHYSGTTDTLQRKRVYIFLTRYGLMFSLNLLVMLVGAVNYTNSLAYALTFLLGGLFLVVMLHTYSNLRGLVLSVSAAEPVFAGQSACFPLLLNNRGGKTRLALNISRPRQVKKLFRKKNHYQALASINITADSVQSRGLDFPATERGYLHPGRVRLASTWPLGLFRAWSYMNIEQACLVYPKPAGSSQLPQSSQVDEEEQSGQGSGTEDFIGFRQYRSGDSMRSVDWKAYARERGLLSKKFSGRGTRKLVLDWEQTRTLGDTEARLSQLCLWILQAETGQCQYLLRIPGFEQQEFSNGSEHKHKCLAALAGFGKTP